MQGDGWLTGPLWSLPRKGAGAGAGDGGPGAVGQGCAYSHIRASILPLLKMATASSRAKVLLPPLLSPEQQTAVALQPVIMAATAVIKKN